MAAQQSLVGLDAGSVSSIVYQAAGGRSRRSSRRWRRDDVDVAQARLSVQRLKNGLSVEQPIAGDKLRAIKRYLATRTDKLPWLFISERGQPLTRQSVNYLAGAAAARAGVPADWPHMLRHSCGFYLANHGHDLRLIQDYLGHRDPKHTVHDTRTAAGRFEGPGDERCSNRLATPSST